MFLVLCCLGGSLFADVTSLPDDLDGEDVSDIWFGATRKRQKPLFWNGEPGPSIRDGKLNGQRLVKELSNTGISIRENRWLVPVAER